MNTNKTSICPNIRFICAAQLLFAKHGHTITLIAHKLQTNMPDTPKRQKSSELQDITIEKLINESSLPDFSCPRALAAFIENSKDILGNVSTTDSNDDLTYTDRKYDAQNLRAINVFIPSSEPILHCAICPNSFLVRSTNQGKSACHI